MGELVRNGFIVGLVGELIPHHYVPERNSDLSSIYNYKMQHFCVFFQLGFEISRFHRCSGDATTSTVVAANQCLAEEPEHLEVCNLLFSS